MRKTKPIETGERVTYPTPIGRSKGVVVNLYGGRTGDWARLFCHDGKYRSIRPSQLKRY